MKNQLLLFAFLLALLVTACKPATKEVAEEPMVDTTAVAPAPAPVTVDSAAIAAKYNEEHAKKPSTNQNPYKSQKGKMEKVDSDPVIATYEAPADTAVHADNMGVYYYPSKWAAFPGGEKALDKFLADNLVYPDDAIDHGIEGTVYVNLIVDEKGNIIQANIDSKRIGYGLETEVLRVVKLMPAWSPGEYNHQSVKTKFTLPVVFDLK